MIPALALTVLLLVLAAFQLALVCGAPLGRFAWGGRHRVLPTRLRIGSAFSLLIYAFTALVALDRSATIDVFPEGFSHVMIWVVFGYFCLGIPMNAMSRSQPERFTMTPVVIVLAGLSLLIALGIGAAAPPA